MKSIKRREERRGAKIMGFSSIIMKTAISKANKHTHKYARARATFKHQFTILLTKKEVSTQKKNDFCRQNSVWKRFFSCKFCCFLLCDFSANQAASLVTMPEMSVMCRNMRWSSVERLKQWADRKCTQQILYRFASVQTKRTIRTLNMLFRNEWIRAMNVSDRAY